MSKPTSETGASGHQRAPVLRESRYDPQVTDELLTVDVGGTADDSYLVVPLRELVDQFALAFTDTDVKGGRHRPQRAMARLLLVMNDLGYVHRPDDHGRIVASR